MHSKRVFCATALRDLKSSDGEIQALVRWSSLESLRIYARMGLEYQAGRRDMLLTANIDSMNAAARDSVPAFDSVNDLHDVPHDAAEDLAAAPGAYESLLVLVREVVSGVIPRRASRGRALRGGGDSYTHMTRNCETAPSLS